MTQEKTSLIAATILGGLMLSLGGFVLYASYEFNSKIAVLEQKIKKQSVHSKHWKLLGWSRDRINELRVHNGLPIRSWPDLGRHEEPS